VAGQWSFVGTSEKAAQINILWAWDFDGMAVMVPHNFLG
jgi:hypothetical protein